MKRIIFSSFLVILLYIPSLLAADYPPVVGLALSKAVPLFKEKQYDKAAAILQETLGKKAGKHKEIYRMLGNCAMLQGQLSQAEKFYQAGIALDKNDPVLWLNLGKAQYESKHPEQAAYSFRTAWENQDKNKRQPEVLYYSAAAWLMAKKSKKALDTFDILFATYPAKTIKVEWREHYIHALVDDGQIKKALPLIRQMISVVEGKKKERWQEILLAQYVGLKMYGKARAFARGLTDQYPGKAKWWKALCHVQLACGKMEDALAALLAYSYLAPLNEKEQSLLADLHLEAGTPVKAAPLYRKVLQKKYSRNILQRLVISLYRQDDIDGALKVLSHYKKEVAQAKDLLQLEGEIYYGRKEFAAAAQAYSKAAVLKGRHQGQCWLMAGYAALRGDDLFRAKRYLKKAASFPRQKKSATGALRMVAARQLEREANS